MGRKAQLKQIKKMNRKEKEKIIVMFKEVQDKAKELRSLAQDKEEIEGHWCSFDLLGPPMFTGKQLIYGLLECLLFFELKT